MLPTFLSHGPNLENDRWTEESTLTRHNKASYKFLKSEQFAVPARHLGGHRSQYSHPLIRTAGTARDGLITISPFIGNAGEPVLCAAVIVAMVVHAAPHTGNIGPLAPICIQCRGLMRLCKTFVHPNRPAVQVKFYRCEACGLADLAQSRAVPIASELKRMEEIRWLPSGPFVL